MVGQERAWLIEDPVRFVVDAFGWSLTEAG